MSKISSTDLVGLALRREIPIGFEKAWEKVTGKNPVRLALRNRESDLMWMKGNAICVLSIIAFLAGAIIFGAINGASTMDTNAAERVMVLVGALSVEIVLLFAAIVFLLLMSTSFFGHDHVRVGPSQTEADSLKEFCADLSAFCEWASIFPIDLEDVGWEGLKQCADGILIREAQYVLSYDKTSTDLSTKYDTFLRLGLVKAGGFKRYFIKAKEQSASKGG